MQGERILSALIGLVGAMSNNGKTADTDRVVLQALRGMNENDAEQTLLADDVRREKFRISPGCASCAAPCGNTSDYDTARFAEEPEEVRNAKEALCGAICRASVRTGESEEVPECVYRGICYLGFELDPMLYREIEEEIEKC